MNNIIEGGGGEDPDNTHPYSVLLLHYLKKKAKINLEVRPAQTAFDSKYTVQYWTKPLMVNSLTNTVD